MEVKEAILTHDPLANKTWADNPKTGISIKRIKSNVS